MKSLLFALLAVAGVVQANLLPEPMVNDNWTSQAGPVTNSTGLCWRDSSWTPASADPRCDGALQPAAPVKAPTVKSKTSPSKAIETIKITYLARTLFDFDRSVIKPEGKQALDQLIARLKTMRVEIVIAVGHTDSVGTDSYNLHLGQRRAEAVKKYLISQGLEAGRIYTDTKGETQPVATNKTAEGRSENRRVVVEVYGVSK
jgi:OmpA-OmpF porin, OOP family